MIKNKIYTVKDVIEYLKTFPSDMEVWKVWDESGEYSPVTRPPARIDQITKNGYIKGEYYKCYGDEPVCKSVVILQDKVCIM